MFKDTSQDFYQTLGLTHTASSDEIKKAYKKLCLKYHPDKTPDKTHHELFLRINEAYEALKSDESRKEYDKKNGFNGPSSPQEPVKSMFSNSYNPFGSNKYSYYGFYKHFYATGNTQEQQAEEARLQKERELEKGRREKAKKKKEEEIFRQKREEMLNRERERMQEKLMREEAEVKQREFEEQEHERQRVAELLYAQRKKEAYRKQWGSSVNPLKQQDADINQESNGNSIFDNNIKSEPTESPSREFKRHGYSSDDPIVLDDEANSGTKKEKGTPPTNSAVSSPDSLSSNDEFVSFSNVEAEDDKSPFRMNTNIPHIHNVIKNDMRFRSRQIPEKRYQKRQSLSPTRGRINVPTSNVRNEPRPATKNKTPKRAKYSNDQSFGMDDLKENLGNDISDVNFKDFYDTLPTDSDRKTRKTSDSFSYNRKKPKRAEFSDGTSNADTLYTPINKYSVSGHSVSNGETAKKPRNITVLDLHASPKIHNYAPPKPPPMIMGTMITPDVWDNYVMSIQNYEKEFLNYKKHIVQYQLERCKKDEEYFDLINSNPPAFEVYQQCLQRDLNVMLEFNDSLREYSNTMNVYKQNCNWMKITNKV